MSASPKMVCSVEFAEGGAQQGVYANAFRVVEDDEANCFLDFLFYLHECNEAFVVARVQVDRSFLSLIRDRMDEALLETGPGEDPELFGTFVKALYQSVN